MPPPPNIILSTYFKSDGKHKNNKYTNYLPTPFDFDHLAWWSLLT